MSAASPTASEPPPGGIRARALAKSFGPQQALQPLDLEIAAGSLVGLIGPNGSGKSTLMRCLVGLCRADQGDIWIDGQPLRGDGAAIRHRLTYAPGEMGVYRETRGRAHLDWFLRGRPAAARRKAREIAEHLGLPLHKRVGQYSHGMKRQLVFAAAMAPKVPIRILDEITEGLDPSKRTQIIEVLCTDAQEGTTILLSSHHFGEVDRVCERILFLQEGRILEDTRASAVRDRAERLLRLVWDDPLAARAFERGLDPTQFARARREEGSGELVLELHQPDPRPVLAHLPSALSAPREVHFGAATLQDLYRDLYGVEGT